MEIKALRQKEQHSLSKKSKTEWHRVSENIGEAGKMIKESNLFCEFIKDSIFILV